MKPVNNSHDEQEITSIDNPQFIQFLMRKWDEIHSQPDVFRYKINNLRERIINKKYILLLNTERGSNRRTPESIDDIRQPFNPEKFNFNKASPREIIFKFLDTDGTDITTFLVNVSPISRYHTLLCPSVNKCLPQVVTEDSLNLVLKIKVFAKDCDLKIIFNSLCAFASVNHLHYHLLFEKHTLHVETADCTHLKGPVYITQNNPVPALCFQVTEETIPQANKDIYKLIDYLLLKSIGHNIVITSGKPVSSSDNDVLTDDEVVRVLVTPRRSTAGEKQLTSFNVAGCELSGWFPVFNTETFDTLTASDLEKELLQWKLPDFAELCEEIKSIY